MRGHVQVQILCFWSFLEWLSFVLPCKLEVRLSNQLQSYLKILTLNLRFPKGDMERLQDALQLPASYICSQETVTTGMEALMILLRRLVYPNRWSDLVPVFGWTVSELSLIFNKVKLLLCSFIFPVEVACIPLWFYHSWIWLGGVESLTVHLLFGCLLDFCLFLDFKGRPREKFNSSYSLE